MIHRSVRTTYLNFKLGNKVGDVFRWHDVCSQARTIGPYNLSGLIRGTEGQGEERMLDCSMTCILRQAHNNERLKAVLRSQFLSTVYNKTPKDKSNFPVQGQKGRMRKASGGPVPKL